MFLYPPVSQASYALTDIILIALENTAMAIPVLWLTSSSTLREGGADTEHAVYGQHRDIQYRKSLFKCTMHQPDGIE
jgi:hypothetical protein